MMMIDARSAGRPYRCTGSSTRVRGVMAASMRAGSMLKLFSSGSTGTGVAPTWVTASQVAM